MKSVQGAMFKGLQRFTPPTTPRFITSHTPATHTHNSDSSIQNERIRPGTDNSRLDNAVSQLIGPRYLFEME